MILLIGAPTLLIYVAILSITLVKLESAAKRNIETEMTRFAANLAARFDGEFREVKTVADTTADFLRAVPDVTIDQIFAQLEANVLQNGAIYGAAMAFEPGSFPTEMPRFSPYVYRNGNVIERMFITEEQYDWYLDPQWTWWALPKQENKGIWTEPYFDEGAGNVLMVTYSAPFYRDGEFRGVTTVDIMLDSIEAHIGRRIIGDQDFAIVSMDGHYIYRPNNQNILGETMQDRLEDSNRDDMAMLESQILSGEPGIVILPEVSLVPGQKPETRWLFHAPIESTDWVLLTGISEAEALFAVHRAGALAGLALGGALVLIIIAIWRVSLRISRPVEQLTETVHSIAMGNFDASIDDVGSQDEIGILARSVNTMSRELRSHITRLAHEQAEREKIERDLNLAREIQTGLLPKEPPVVPGFEIGGWNRPADKTGGDYFDLLTLPNQKTLFALADVTGHGVGPALIAAVFRAYLRAAALGAHDALTQVLAIVNRFICADTPVEKFVTAAIGVLDPTTHTAELASGGQAPLLFFEAATGEVHNWNAENVPFGVVDDWVFEPPRTVKFAPGDMLVLATDGFFEWMNGSHELFGTQRVIDYVRTNHALPTEKFIDGLHKAVRKHGGGTLQGDDLTIILIRRRLND